MNGLKQLWRFVRDDIWTHIAFAMFCIAILGLLVPKLYREMPPIYGQVIFALAAAFFLMRVIKLSVLLAFGEITTACVVDIAHHGRGPCVVSYRYQDGEKTENARRQIFFRNGELQLLYLRKFARFHLVAWQKSNV